MDLLGLLLVFRGRDGRSVAAVDGPGNEPLTLGILLFLKVIEQIQLGLFGHWINKSITKILTHVIDI